jgi:hypothetical protein
LHLDELPHPTNGATTKVANKGDTVMDDFTNTYDPSERIWHNYYCASIQGGRPPTEARREADKALAEHFERWPRERKVIPLTEHEDQIRRVRRGVLDDLHMTLMHGGRGWPHDGVGVDTVILSLLRAVEAASALGSDGRCEYRGFNWHIPQPTEAEDATRRSEEEIHRRLYVLLELVAGHNIIGVTADEARNLMEEMRRRGWPSS